MVDALDDRDRKISDSTAHGHMAHAKMPIPRKERRESEKATAQRDPPVAALYTAKRSDTLRGHPQTGRTRVDANAAS